MALREYRKKIDEIDSRIIEYLNARSELAAKIGAWKKDRDHPVYVPERESALLRRLKERNKGPLSDSALANIYREIISGAIAVEHPVRVARVATPDDFNHPARLTFGDSAVHIQLASVAEALDALRSGEVDYAVLDVVGVDGDICEPVVRSVIENTASIVAERISTTSERTAWVLGCQTTEPSGCDRTALVAKFSGPEEAVAKAAELTTKIGLLRIDVGTGAMKQSGSKTSFRKTLAKPFAIAINDVVFMVVSGHQDDDTFKDVLDKLDAFADSIRITASFPTLV